ncbi:MAG: FAD-dependent oxidoreductase [Holophagales bacterium]|nr:MAG: FAD-dependent oxidoreductase [Holophagales bacterium]
MARTPLFRRLQRAFALARLAEQRGEPETELVERLAEARTTAFSRREVLAVGGFAAAGIALGGRWIGAAPAAPAMGEVAIVGAGVAGLTAAHRLVQAGVSARIYEAQERVGGRMLSLRRAFPEGQVCELGGELVDTNHTALRGLCGELGLELDDFTRDDPAVSRDVWYFDGRRIRDAEIVAAFRPIARQIEAAWAALSGEDVTQASPNGGETVDRQSIAEWLEKAGCSGWLYRLLEVGYVTEFGLEIDRQSAWNLLSMISTEPGAFEIFGESDERFHIRGGNDQVPLRLAEGLGERIERGHRLEALTQRSDGRFELTFRTGESSKVVAAERVVLALPFTLLRQVDLRIDLPEVKRRAITELGMGMNAKVMVGFDDRLWRTRGRSNGSVLTDLPFQLSWESTRLQPGRGGIVVAYSGGLRGLEVGQGTPAEQARAFAREYDRLFPGVAAKRNTEARFHWPTHPWTLGSYACYLPGQWTGIRGAEGARVGALHFAGEHTSLDFQGYMEGGCESGERVAGEILTDLGRSKLPAGG